MNKLSDQELLREYARHKSEPAFAELVQRHVDFVYSAALRMVGDSHLAGDVTQNVFIALSQDARKLAGYAVLAGWLHRTAQNISANAIRSETRRRNRELEAAAMNEQNSPEPLWLQIAPQLDAALQKLNEADREALLLRYFQRKSAQEMGEILGVSNEAAQKRVSRAVERLRELISGSGVTIGTGALVALLTTNAVQAAPAGLALAVTSSAALATIKISTATVTQAIAMTTLQKTIVATTITAALCTALYQRKEATELRRQNQLLVQQNEGLPALLANERRDFTNQLDALLAENQQLKANQNSGEVLRLRGELARLMAKQASMPRNAVDADDPAVQRFLEFKGQAMEIARVLEERPDKKIPELSLLSDEDWLTAVKTGKLDTEENIRKTLSTLRSLAKNRLPLGGALHSFTAQNNGQLPNHISELKPYLKAEILKAYEQNKNPSGPPPDDVQLDAMLARYKLQHTGKLKDVPPEAWVIVEIAPVDKDYDSRAKFIPGGSTIIGTGKNSSGDPEDKSY